LFNFSPECVFQLILAQMHFGGLQLALENTKDRKDEMFEWFHRG